MNIAAIAAMPDTLAGRYDVCRDVYYPALLDALGRPNPPKSEIGLAFLAGEFYHSTSAAEKPSRSARLRGVSGEGTYFPEASNSFSTSQTGDSRKAW